MKQFEKLSGRRSHSKDVIEPKRLEIIVEDLQTALSEFSTFMVTFLSKE
jgi:hypothetical protein